MDEALRNRIARRYAALEKSFIVEFSIRPVSDSSGLLTVVGNLDGNNQEGFLSSSRRNRPSR